MNKPSDNVVSSVNMIVMLISLLLTIPPDISIVAKITSDDSKPLNVDDVNVISATIEINNNYNRRHMHVSYYKINTFIINDCHCR